MRYIGLLITVAIIYIVYTRMSSMNSGEKAEVTQALNAASTPVPGASGSARPASTPTDSLKAPLDRTREVLDQVRKQKSADQF